LGEAGVGVVLTPPRAFPEVWDERRILPGPPLSEETAVRRLVSNGVVVGLGTHRPYGRWSARLLPWDLGWAAVEANGTLSRADALAMGSTNVEHLLGVTVEDDQGDLVATVGGDLLGMEGKPTLVVSPRQKIVHLF